MKIVCAVSKYFDLRRSRRPNMVKLFSSWGKSCVVLLLWVHISDGSPSVSISKLCKQRGGSLQLSSSSATSLVLEHFNHSQPCRVEIKAPPTHHISMLYVPRKRAVDRILSGKKPANQCLLTISYPVPKSQEDVRTTIDLCSSSALEPIKYTELLPPVIILEWHHTGSSLLARADDAVAKELVFAAVGRGQEICSRGDMFPCIARPQYAIYCIATKLVCDGNRNCPYSGNDEDQTLCDADENLDRLPSERSSENFRLGQGLQFLASEMLRKFIVSKNNNKKTDVTVNSTEKTTVLWFDEETGGGRSESLPNVLNHYGPWGYLMLGMLICGTVLMFCGLWECCCRRPKVPTSTAGPTLLIINQGAQTAEGLEVPATPSPPRYEDLDQPPSYTSLFPNGKPSSSGGTPEPPSTDAEPANRVEIYTIDVPIPDTRPKP